MTLYRQGGVLHVQAEGARGVRRQRRGRHRDRHAGGDAGGGRRRCEQAVRVANRAAGIVVGSSAPPSVSEERQAVRRRRLKEMHVLRRHRRRRLHRIATWSRALNRARRSPTSSPWTTCSAATSSATWPTARSPITSTSAISSRSSNPGELDGAIDAVLHQGACSDTMETDGRYMMENNYRYSMALLRLVPGRGSAADLRLVGRGLRRGRGVREERENEAPLNVYGYSKFLFDQVVRRRLRDAGPRRSRACAISTSTGRTRRTRGAWLRSRFHFFNQFRAEGRVRLFDGSAATATASSSATSSQSTTWSRSTCSSSSNRDMSGIFNCGTGRAQTFNDVAAAVINAVRNELRMRSRSRSCVQKDLSNTSRFRRARSASTRATPQADLGRAARRRLRRRVPRVEAGRGATTCDELLGK